MERSAEIHIFWKITIRMVQNLLLLLKYRTLFAQIAQTLCAMHM